MFNVLDNVPMPKTSRVNGQGKSKYPYSSLKVGQMFFIPNKPKNTMATSASTAGKQLGRKFSTRLIRMKETVEGWKPAQPNEDGAVIGVGVWRTE